MGPAFAEATVSKQDRGDLGFAGLGQLALFLLLGFGVLRGLLFLLFGLFLFAFCVAHGISPVVVVA